MTTVSPHSPDEPDRFDSDEMTADAGAIATADIETTMATNPITT
jgi:hypothetical protein